MAYFNGSKFSTPALRTCAIKYYLSRPLGHTALFYYHAAQILFILLPGNNQ